jgi:hypothetical protein
MSPLFSEIFKSEESQKISYSENAKLTCLKLISGAFKNPNFHRNISKSIVKPTSEIFTTCTPISLLCLCKISRSETSQKISYSESAKMTCLKLISGAFRNPNFHREYLQKYSEPTYEILPHVHQYLSSVSTKFQGLKHPRK